LKKDGTLFPVRLAVSEVRLADRLLFTGFIEDLTERKRLEREAEEWREELERRVRQRTSDLARANEELEHFAHTVSHDLRTPLRGIRNYVDFLSEDLAGTVSGESAEDLKRLGHAAEELDLMIQEILNYSRIGRVEASAENVDLNDLIHNIEEVVATSPDRKVVVKGKLPVLFAPGGLVRQIFQNLIENGLYYNKSESKTVELSAEPVAAPEKRWRFFVKDNGIGIEPRYHQKVFGMFQRLHTDSDYPGTGIGLAAVRKAVLHMNGSIELKSAPGAGTTFIVELPAETKAR
jgi:light-regulated signal transduction histidine kinase (bacteriophytochrome)